MEHEALSQIVEGFKTQMNGQSVTIKVLNAQGDPNIQRALIEQSVRDHYDLIVPIGTAASQMTLNLAKNQKIVCLAADSKLITSDTKEEATAIDDELSVDNALSFLRAAFPQMRKISLIYSSSEKVAKEVPLVLHAAQAEGISVQKLMVQNHSDLYTLSQAIASDSEAIFLLKDHLVVSGIQIVVQQAEKRGIPVMASDEGSVIHGAAFAIGVKEEEIGKQGAVLAKNILAGTSPKNIPPQTIEGPFPIFINKSAFEKQGIDSASFIQCAEELGMTLLPVEKLSTK
jgi:putative ABC transport system substrate-binding protein